MNFAFDEQQRSLGETVAAVLADMPALIAPDLDASHDEQVWSALAEIGLFALAVPEASDGVGLSLVDLALAVEALGGGLAPPIIASTLACTDLLVRHGSERQKSEWLARIARGEEKIAIAHVEREADYDASTLTTSVAAGLLSGTKLMVAGARDATAFLVVGRADGGNGLWLVDARADGVTVTDHDSLDPSARLGAVRFDAVTIGNDGAVSAGGKGDSVGDFLDVAATLDAGMLIGIAARMLAASVEYAKTREQFGRPIGSFQAIKHRCADMAVAVEAGRSAAYYAFWAVSEGGADQSRAASMAKAYCGEVARSVCNEAIQVHGGMGFTWELGLHRFLRRAKLHEHSFGDAAYHHERVLAETLASLSRSGVSQRDAA